MQIERTLGTVGDCVQYKEEVKSAIEELINNSKEAQAEAEKILDTESLLQAQQLLFHHQVSNFSINVHILSFSLRQNVYNYQIIFCPVI